MLASSRPRDLQTVEAPSLVVVDLGPRQAADQRGSPGPRSQAEPDDRLLEGVRVLVVEDETIVALDLIQMLEDLGADVCGSAVSGADALRKAHALRPELAVVDIRLKDGETGVDAARSMAEELGTVIVFATAHTDPLLRRRMETVLGSTHLPKPYGMSELEDAARRVLRRQ
jgi:two-component system, response regulator PdtaR